MTVAVTGAGGFVGRALVRRLLERGAEVVAFVRPGGATALRGLVAVREADFERPAEAAAAVARVQPRLCYHLAATGAVVRDADDGRVVTVNALGPFELARALGGNAGRLVTAGSSSEYGPVEGPMSEERASAPDDVYGAAKAAGHLLARAAATAAGLELCHLRLFAVYGPGEDERRLIASVARALVAGRPVDLTPGGQVRDFVYVDDVVDALLAAGEAPAVTGEALNVGTGTQTSVREACLLLARAAGADPALLRFGALPYRRDERFAWCAEPTRAEQLLGWRAETPLADGLRRTVAALRPAEVAA